MSNKLSHINCLIAAILAMSASGYGCQHASNHEAFSYEASKIDTCDLTTPTDLDSVKIRVGGMQHMEITLYPTMPGHVRLINISGIEIYRLSGEYSSQTFSYIDSIFIKKLVPVVISRTWRVYVTESQSMNLLLTLYNKDGSYKRTITYPRKNANYVYEYSGTFYRLINNMRRIGQF